MDPKQLLNWGITALFLVIVVWVVVAQLFGYPFLLGVVETDSMEPTIEVGEGYLAVPTPLAGDVGEGDVVTFDAQVIDGGGPTTHRIAEETDGGYITRGDGNPFDDQEAGEPPVQDHQISAVVLEFRGDVITVPFVGQVSALAGGFVSIVAGTLSGLGLAVDNVGGLIVAVGIGLVILSLLWDLVAREGRSTVRSVSRREQLHSGWILAGLVLVLAVPIMTGMVVASDSDSIQIVSAVNPDENDPTSIGVNDSVQIDYTVENVMVVPRYVVLESPGEGVSFDDDALRVGHGERVNTTLELHADDETGLGVRSRGEYHYYHVIPAPMIQTLHDVHPFVANGTITLVVLTPVIGLFALFVGFRPITLRDIHD